LCADLLPYVRRNQVLQGSLRLREGESLEEVGGAYGLLAGPASAGNFGGAVAPLSLWHVAVTVSSPGLGRCGDPERKVPPQLGPILNSEPLL